jgi:3D (Asp-Asp-Asp) domain-containing protein
MRSYAAPLPSHRDPSLVLSCRQTPLTSLAAALGGLLLALLLTVQATWGSAMAASTPQYSGHHRTGMRTVPATMLTTAYCQTGYTASGSWSRWGTIAATLPFGTRMYVPGYGFGVVLDRGGAVGPGHIDLYMPDCQQALAWGARMVRVQISVHP